MKRTQQALPGYFLLPFEGEKVGEEGMTGLGKVQRRKGGRKREEIPPELRRGWYPQFQAGKLVLKDWINKEGGGLGITREGKQGQRVSLAGKRGARI